MYFASLLRKRSFGVVLAVIALGVFAGNTLAVDVADVSWSADITTAIVGLVAGVVAAIAIGFGAAALVKVSRTAARAALKAIGMIK